MPRTTIRDVARAAGVSKGAASHALNGKPGVSEATRERVKAAARELGWRPDFAARALSGASTGAVGMAVARPAEIVAADHFFMALLSGMEEELSRGGLALMLQMVPDLEAEVALLERWASERRVDGLVLLDPRLQDPRIPVIERLGIPAASFAVSPLSPVISTLVIDESARLAPVIEHLLQAGHERLAYLGGPGEFEHVQRRAAVLGEHCGRGGARISVTCTDYSMPAAERWLRAFAALPPPRRPTAVVADNDLLALRLLQKLTETGFAVPADLALVSLEDSMLCTLTTPPITALRRDLPERGRRLASLLVESIAGSRRHDRAPTDDLIVRASV